MSDPWLEEWNTLSYTERLNWWWAARAAYQSQEDFAAGKVAPEGVSCKYGIPGFWPGTRTPYVKPVPAATVTEESNKGEVVAAEPVKEETTDDSKPEDATPVESKPEETPAETEKPGTVNLIIPPGTSMINVHKSNAKKRKNKGKH